MANRNSANYVDVEIDEIVHATEAALLCLISEEEIWIPKSQIANSDEFCGGEVSVVLEVSTWFAKRKGLGE